MATSNVPARVPERQPEPNTTARPAAWPEKKPSRFVIKIAGTIPTAKPSCLKAFERIRARSVF